MAWSCQIQPTQDEARPPPLELIENIHHTILRNLHCARGPGVDTHARDAAISALNHIENRSATNRIAARLARSRSDFEQILAVIEFTCDLDPGTSLTQAQEGIDQLRAIVGQIPDAKD